MNSAHFAQAEDLPLPPLREDLRLSEALPGRHGEPAWVIEDTVINRFYRIGWLEFECLLRWGRTARQLSTEIAEQTALKPDSTQILEFRHFLERHQLLRPDAKAVERLQSRSEGNPWLTWRWWLHNYLFIRIPLIHPQPFLQRLAKQLAWLFSPVTGIFVLLLSLVGIVLVGRQWDTFSSSVVESFSTAGVLSFALAICLAKAMHEMGHALVATRHGVRVAHMGIAFVVLWPMLYTDTGESWKLRQASQRLSIASAGIITELSLAGLSTFGWAICEPGPLRNALLYLATTSWVLSIALNASPFMRFDGYFILSDLLDFPNLHERSSALARTTLRRNLLGLMEEWPEHFPVRQRRLLVSFAFLTWIYRFILFLGIATAVYLMFFKLLGIFLFIVEIAWFIAMPVWRELKYWWANRSSVKSGRRHSLLIVSGLLLLLLAIPWRNTVHALGVARAEQQLRVFAPYPARLRKLAPAGLVEAGASLVVLEEPDILSRQHSSQVGAQSYSSHLRGLIATPDGMREQNTTAQRLGVQYEEVRAAQSEIERLDISAPFSGHWQDLNPEWNAGQWVSRKEQLGILIDPSAWHVDAYIALDDVRRVAQGNSVLFYADGVPSPISGRLIELSSSPATELDHPMLAARFGGPLTTANHNESLKPSPAVFHAVIQLDAPPESLRETLGQVQIKGEKRSLLGAWLTSLLAILMRESGF